MGLLDIKKAFDSVWKEGLIWKLRNLGIGEDTVRLVDSFLTDRDARVSVDGGESDKFRVLSRLTAAGIVAAVDDPRSGSLLRKVGTGD